MTRARIVLTYGVGPSLTGAVVLAKPDEIGCTYFSVCAEGFSEALTIVVARTRQNTYVANRLEFGRP